jgi:hypothetical protein
VVDEHERVERQRGDDVGELRLLRAEGAVGRRERHLGWIVVASGEGGDDRRETGGAQSGTSCHGHVLWVGAGPHHKGNHPGTYP